MKKNRNEDPTVSVLSGQNQGSAYSTLIGFWDRQPTQPLFNTIPEKIYKELFGPGFIDNGLTHPWTSWKTSIVGLAMIYNINCFQNVLTILTGCSMKNDSPDQVDLLGVVN